MSCNCFHHFTGIYTKISKNPQNITYSANIRKWYFRFEGEWHSINYAIANTFTSRAIVQFTLNFCSVYIIKPHRASFFILGLCAKNISTVVGSQTYALKVPSYLQYRMVFCVMSSVSLGESRKAILKEHRIAFLNILKFCLLSSYYNIQHFITPTFEMT